MKKQTQINIQQIYLEIKHEHVMLLGFLLFKKKNEKKKKHKHKSKAHQTN
jgi:hypothetical protein